MNRHVLPGLVALVLLATTGCSPRHPPHTPQPFGMESAVNGTAFITEP